MCSSHLSGIGTITEHRSSRVRKTEPRHDNEAQVVLSITTLRWSMVAGLNHASVITVGQRHALPGLVWGRAGIYARDHSQQPGNVPECDSVRDRCDLKGCREQQKGALQKSGVSDRGAETSSGGQRQERDPKHAFQGRITLNFTLE